MKIKKGDKIKVISGKDRGKVAPVLMVLNKKGKIVVQGVNIAKKHVKPGAISKEGGIISIERPINVSNVMFYDEKTNKTTRISSKLIDGKVYRISKKTGEVVDKKL